VSPDALSGSKQFPQVRRAYGERESIEQAVLSAGLDDQGRSVLQETGLNPHSLKLEITESVIMQNAATVTATLDN
jgi:EAL domain-containing protein (putative c-di-GMP-specific phosphodiesterase class I)